MVELNEKSFTATIKCARNVVEKYQGTLQTCMRAANPVRLSLSNKSSRPTLLSLLFIPLWTSQNLGDYVLPKVEPVANLYEVSKLEYFLEIDAAMQRQWELVSTETETEEWDSLWTWV